MGTKYEHGRRVFRGEERFVDVTGGVFQCAEVQTKMLGKKWIRSLAF